MPPLPYRGTALPQVYTHSPITPLSLGALLPLLNFLEALLLALGLLGHLVGVELLGVLPLLLPGLPLFEGIHFLLLEDELVLDLPTSIKNKTGGQIQQNYTHLLTMLSKTI